MLKCKFIGHYWSKWEMLPAPSFRGLTSSVREQKRECERCGKTEIEYVSK